MDAGIVMEEGEYFRKKTQTAFKAEMLRFKLQHHQFEFEFFFKNFRFIIILLFHLIVKYSTFDEGGGGVLGVPGG